MTSFASEENPEKLVAAAGFVIFGVLLLGCGCVLLWFSFLRETHSFWLNSGGYPILLRDLVLIFYYPLLLLCIAGMIGLTAAAFVNTRLPIGFVCFEGLVITGCWSLVIGSMTVSFTNNVDNLWSGRPLHYKPLESRP